MDTENNNKKITAIVPAYNEAERIGRVLDVLTAYPRFSEIIVVDDGSTDNTEAAVKKYPVHYIRNEINRGKGHVMDIGVNQAGGKIIFFVDADVSGLTHEMIDDMIGPVIDGKVDMFIGMRNRKIYYLKKIIALVPLLGGERALLKELWQSLPAYYKHRFRIEAGLNFYSQYYGKGFRYKVFPGLSQVIKEKKYGFYPGMKQRLGMFYNIFSTQLKLQLTAIPESEKNLRLLSAISLQSFLGLALGVIILVAAHFGPHNFVLKVFAEELKEDPGAPFVHYLLYLTSITTVSTFAVIGGFILLTNSITFLLTFKKLGYIFNIITRKNKKNVV